MKKIIITALIAISLSAPLVALAAAGNCDPSLSEVADTFKNAQYCTANSFLVAVIKLLLSISFIVSVLFVVFGGYQYITSAGNEEQAGKGKKVLTNALIGLVIIILAYTIVNVVINATATVK